MNHGSKDKGLSLKRLPWIWIALCVVLAVVSLVLVNKYGGELTPTKTGIDQSQREVTLYFTSKDGKLLAKESGAIKKGTVEVELQGLIELLMKGPGGKLGRTIPVGTLLHGVEIKDGIALINFSTQIRNRHWGGSTAELLTIYSIVNSVTDNFEKIKKVQILITGLHFSTLAGHIKIDKPLLPKSDMIEVEGG